ASRPGRGQSSTRKTSSFRSLPSGSCCHAACHSTWPYLDSAYAPDRTATVLRARDTPSSIPRTQCEPTPKSHACNRTRNPSSSNTQPIHSAHPRSDCVYETKKSHTPSTSPPPTCQVSTKAT